MQRTLHPVGQGGFYTEQFFIEEAPFKDSKLFNVVYDCGSISIENVSREIRKKFPKNSLIDALFISHFDWDHINGLSKLKERRIRVRYLILPLLTNTQKILAYLSIGLTKFDVDSIKHHLGIDAETVIFILPPSSIEQNNQGDEGADITLGESDVQKRSVIYLQSDKRLSIEDYIKWVYIPFNICDNSLYEILLKKLESDNKLKNKLESIANDCEINNIEELLDDSERQKLSEIYRDITNRDKNKSSVVLYSGPYKKTGRYFSRFLMDLNREYDLPDKISQYCLRSCRTTGAIYMGDLDLNAKIQLTSSKSIYAIEYIGLKLSDYSDYIGLIQVPHHGSRHNFNPAIMKEFPNAGIFFYSFGYNNNYTHPYAGVKIVLLAKRKHVIEITEESNSEQSWLIEIR